MPYIDAHMHVVPDDVFYKARQRGVEKFFVNATSQNDWQAVLDLSERILGVYPCLGIHPWYVDTAVGNWEADLIDLLRAHPLAMVGEIGLDKGRQNFLLQQDIFRRQLQIAADMKRSVHIHCVKAWDEMFEIIGEFRDVKMLLHRFGGDEILVQKFRMLNAYFSVLNDKVYEVVPDNRLLVESDAPSGLKSPEAIPDLVWALKLDENYLMQTAEDFLDGR